MTKSTALQQELIQLETRFWDAMQRRDADAVADLTADRSVVVGASGAMALDPRSLAQSSIQRSGRSSRTRWIPRPRQ
jgi:hypothetical protein